ncbi:uncharacterized protein LOC129765838 [Toxorhynchites rutilus septentrionalis]|uniref:uncharacterized protein LOC129765838 n=1 Tax=Toxorhynchites rutilus septentrionalis TaxID=329112 RepID=UPI0024792B87|nr:uncharacterized protein LOC129765838 [Toxorhynchites rutilus septentrionalis]
MVTNKTHKIQNNVKLIQVNLHHAKGASSVLCRRFIHENLDVALIQEPWFNNHRIRGISTPKKFINRDIVAIQLEVPTTRGKTAIIIASAYFPGDNVEIPPLEVAALVQHCKLKNKQFIIGCDANAHHTVWGSSDVNTRGECLLEYLMSHNINICNQGNDPTFVNSVRQEVLDLTLCSSKLSDTLKNWHVSSEESLSDHKHIMFNYNSGDLLIEQFRDPRKTNWDIYHSKLLDNNSMSLKIISSTEQLELVSSEYGTNISSTFEESCPLTRKTSSKDASWWNKKLEKLRKLSRKLFNKAKITSNWTEYKNCLTEYNKEIRKSKRRTWKLTCEAVAQQQQ